jgi:hydroxyethylthiazole kinase-like uncharacterized protein yjeF
MEPLLTPDQCARIDQSALACGTSLADLMENAGRAVAHAIRRHYKPSRVLVLAGPGNNGGDGYVAARLLAQWGWPVAVAPVLGPPTAPEAAAAAARWHGPLVTADTHIHRADLAIDAIVGAGLSRDLAPNLTSLLAKARTLIAIDMLSGIDGTNGALRGVTAVADRTITFVARKPGHLLYPGRAHTGTLLCADIAMPAAALATITVNLWRNNPGLWRLPALDPAGHKYERGSVTILSGTMPGAALLAATASRRTGAGLVTIAAPAPIGAPPGIITTTDPLATLLTDARRQTWLCGPGLGIDRAGHALAALIAARRTIVADADALTACAGVPDRLRGTTIITPHRGEFRRLFSFGELDKLTATRSAAAQTGAIVIYKGADTIIAAPDGRAAINDNAPPSLATAGAGDVLAGIAAALLAQGMPPFEAACAAVWLHATAATRVGAGLIAEDIAPHLPAAIAQATLSLI